MNKNTRNKIFAHRFDLMAKFIYVKYKELSINTSFHVDVYREHIRTFNNFKEIDNNKNNEHDFFNAFNNLISNMKENGFDVNHPIPLGKNKTLKNGAHRFVTSYFLNIEPKFHILNENFYDNYNYEFFLKRQNNPLSRKYGDFIALEGVKNNDNIRCMVIYPNVFNHICLHMIKKIIMNYGTIYYEKSVSLNDNGLNNLIIEQYRGEDWIGGLFPAFGQGGKFQRCRGRGQTHIILIHMPNTSIDNLNELKNKCRHTFKGLGKHSLHMSDYQEDTFRIASSLLNENSINYLNKGSCNISNNTQKLLEKYFNTVKGDENYCITSSLILELFELQKCNDLNYLHKDDHNLNIKNMSQHTGKWLDFYSTNVDNIIYNPDNHFYYNGHKFISLDILREMKNRRKELKDVKDLKLLDKL